MREIIFRGKRLDNGEWAEGYLYEHEPELVGIVSENDVPEPSKWFIARTAFADWNMPRLAEFVEVDSSTVGQYTGMNDKNGQRIFEGDILGSRYDELYPDDVAIEVVQWFRNGWYIRQGKNLPDALDECGVLPYSEVIGNVHDNPELIKEEAQT